MIKVDLDEIQEENDAPGFIKITREEFHDCKNRKIKIMIQNKISVEVDENISEKNLRKIFKASGGKNVQRFF